MSQDAKGSASVTDASSGAADLENSTTTPGNGSSRRRVKVVSVLELTEDVHRFGIQRGMRVLDLGCGAGDVSLRIAKLVGPSGLVLGVDESAEDIDVAERRATVAGQCYWTRFVTADLETFIPHGRFDVVVVHRALPLERERATLLRLSTWVHPDGVTIVIAEKPAGSTDNGSLIGGK
jgi:2-polyprenyl-3-methyl-5-hydroxy-6-metoxy-1,4-benzoquinol methylase